MMVSHRVSSPKVSAFLPTSLSGLFLRLSRARSSTVPRRHAPRRAIRDTKARDSRWRRVSGIPRYDGTRNASRARWLGVPGLRPFLGVPASARAGRRQTSLRRRLSYT